MAGNQGSFISTATFSELTDLIDKMFVSRQNMPTRKAKELFIYDSIPDGNGDTKRYDEYDTETFARSKPEGVNVKKAKFGIGYNKTVRNKTVGIEIDITKEMRKFNKSAEVKTAMTNLGDFVPNKIDLDGTHRFTFATSTSYTDRDGNTVDTTVGDGLALASSAHTLAHSALTYSNRVSGDPLFSKGGLEAAELLFETNILSNFGEKRVMTPNTIITTTNPNLMNNVKQFLNSISDVDQNNSGVDNVYNGKYRHVSLPYFATTADSANDSTKAQWWALASITGGLDGWQAYYSEWEAPSLINPSADSNMVDNHADIWTWGTRGMYNFCVVSPKGIVFSCPTS